VSRSRSPCAGPTVRLAESRRGCPMRFRSAPVCLTEVLRSPASDRRLRAFNDGGARYVRHLACRSAYPRSCVWHLSYICLTLSFGWQTPWQRLEEVEFESNDARWKAEAMQVPRTACVPKYPPSLWRLTRDSHLPDAVLQLSDARLPTSYSCPAVSRSCRAFEVPVLQASDRTS
jgi:hypothetical protein